MLLTLTAGACAVIAAVHTRMTYAGVAGHDSLGHPLIGTVSVTVDHAVAATIGCGVCVVLLAAWTISFRHRGPTRWAWFIAAALLVASILLAWYGSTVPALYR